jgi:myosin heavy subunit
MALSALTAYYADIWGRKLGKQRKTLFGWRPKRTAVFIITVSGAMIALLSFVVLLTADKGIRRALTQWDQTVDRLTKAQAEVDRQKAALASSEADVHAIETRLNSSRQQFRAAAARVAAAQAQLKIRQENLQRVQADLTQARYGLQQAAAQVQQTHAELSAAQDDLTRTRAAVAKGKAELARIKTYSDRATQAAFESTRLRLLAERNASEAAQGVYGVQRGDELIRRVIPPQSTLAQARENVARTLNDARTMVAKRARERAIPFDTGVPYVKLLPKIIRTTVDGKPATRIVSEQKVLDAVASQLLSPNSPSPGGVVLQVIAMQNALLGQTAIVDFRLTENHVVFEKGTELARITLNSRQTKAEVMDALTGSLMEVRTSALKNNLMRNSDDSVGSLPAYQLPDVYSEVQRAFRERQDVVTVHIYAAQDTWTAGPLTLRFKVDR